MKRLIILCGAIAAIAIQGCKETTFGPLVKNGNTPGKLTNLTVENLPGGAKVGYTLPNDEDVLYVLAEFSAADGTKRNVKASSYSNYIILDGFADENERKVTLSVVNRSENRSEPVEVTIKPERAYLHDVFGSLRVRETFGGIDALFSNEHEGEYIFHTMLKNEEGEWEQYDRLYTKSKEREYAVRDLPAEPIEFAFFFTDKWKNNSDTLVANLTPLFETQLDKALWKHLPLLNDTYTSEYATWAIQNLWNGNTANFFYVKAALPGLALPNWFTIDLGQEAKFSRIRVQQLSHANAWIFASGAPQQFEIYGSNSPASDGSWDSWTLLGQYESVKPSGSALGFLSNEDIAVGKAGEDFNFSVDAASYRYIRFKTNRTWGGNLNPMIAELTLWGQPVN